MKQFWPFLPFAALLLACDPPESVRLGQDSPQGASAAYMASVPFCTRGFSIALGDTLQEVQKALQGSSIYELHESPEWVAVRRPFDDFQGDSLLTLKFSNNRLVAANLLLNPSESISEKGAFIHALEAYIPCMDAIAPALLCGANTTYKEHLQGYVQEFELIHGASGPLAISYSLRYEQEPEMPTFDLSQNWYFL